MASPHNSMSTELGGLRRAEGCAGWTRGGKSLGQLRGPLHLGHEKVVRGLGMEELWRCSRSGGSSSSRDACRAVWAEMGRDAARWSRLHKCYMGWPAARQCCSRPLTTVSSWQGHKGSEAVQTGLRNPPQIHVRSMGPLSL